MNALFFPTAPSGDREEREDEDEEEHPRLLPGSAENVSSVSSIRVVVFSFSSLQKSAVTNQTLNSFSSFFSPRYKSLNQRERERERTHALPVVLLKEHHQQQRQRQPRRSERGRRGKKSATRWH
jgi:hypothetical protein